MSATFLQQLAQARPDPGGGAAAAYSAQVAMALVMKVIRLEAARPRDNELPKKIWREKLATARRLSRSLAQLRQTDVEAYRAMAQALAAGKKGNSRDKQVEAAITCPVQIMGRILLALELTHDAGAACRPQLLSDLLVAAELLGGALQGAHHIAKANLPLFASPTLREQWTGRLTRSSHEGLEATLRVRSSLLGRAHAHPHP
jgi:formiminotetrahydrofolate cyclodeaminase